MVNRDPLTKAPNVRLTMCEMIPGSLGEMIITINQTARGLHRGALLPLVIAPLRLQNGCLLVGQKGPISKAGGNVLAARAWVVGKQQVIPIVQAIPMCCMPPTPQPTSWSHLAFGAQLVELMKVLVNVESVRILSELIVPLVLTFLVLLYRHFRYVVIMSSIL